VIYLYAIAPVGGRAPDCPGLEDRPLMLLGPARVAGLCSEHERLSFPISPPALWRHDRVVQAAMGEGPVLPARFGTSFRDTDALCAALEPAQERLLRQMERVRGCIELAVRVTPPAKPASVTRNGVEYLRDRLDRQREARAVAACTLLPLAAHAVQFRCRPPATAAAILGASYLVRLEDVENFTGCLRRLAADHPELSLTCTGPWPPYSFVGEEETVGWVPDSRAAAGSEAS